MDYGPLCVIDKDDGDGLPPTTPGKRRDGRTDASELRAIYVRGGILSSATGSSYMESGSTKVFAAVYGPRSSSGGGHGQLGCEVRFAGGGLSDEEREMGRALYRSLIPAVLLERYDRCRIDVCVFVLEDGGGVFAHAVTAACYALADAHVEMIGLVVGLSVGVSSDGATLLVDPCDEEERKGAVKSGGGAQMKEDEEDNEGAALVTLSYLINDHNKKEVTNLIVRRGVVGLDALQKSIDESGKHVNQIYVLLKKNLEKQVKKAIAKKQ